MKKRKKKKFGADMEWATAHLSIGAVSQYNHCIVTQWDGRLAWLKRKFFIFFKNQIKEYKIFKIFFFKNEIFVDKKKCFKCGIDCLA